MRVPLTNSSLTDAVFEVEQDTTAEEVNELLTEASNTYLKNILRVRHQSWACSCMLCRWCPCLHTPPATLSLQASVLWCGQQHRADGLQSFAVRLCSSMVMGARMPVHRVSVLVSPVLRSGVHCETHAADRGVDLAPPDSASFDDIWLGTGSCHRPVPQSMSL